ncbi:MAG: gabD [Gammaproteobacteria bacterium]|jgi:succinate-semialdehyde dehydrogenase/glutarate-semialdehyde dehydrogenase|nr:gabD [Gammaproteobacteria bacterium]
MKNNLSSKKIISLNPADQSVIGEMEASTPHQITEKIKYARAAAPLWKAFGVEKRIDILRPLQELFKKKKEEIAYLTTQEIGKPILESLSDFEGDFIYLNNFLTEGANYIADEIVFQKENAIHRITYEPRGVVACIAPWNYPFGNFIWSVIPNLIVGNTVVFKHSEECPHVSKLLEESLLSLKELPHGVFSAIYGDAEEGTYLVQQEIDMIWFTGSSLVGRELAAIAGRKQIKALLEMGGSNPAIILEDADVDGLMEKVYMGRFLNGGQVCDAIKRLLVHDTLFDQVVDRLTHRLKKIKIGDPQNKETELGPLVSLSHRETLEAQVNDALAKGATLMIGGKRPGKFSGAYYTPTLLTHIKKEMRVWQEEVFGPVLPIVSFKNDKEAIHLANDTSYGLGALICSKDINKARYIASHLQAGCVEINHGNHWQPCTPFGGWKASGRGHEHGRHGFQELCQMKVIAEA